MTITEAQLAELEDLFKGADRQQPLIGMICDLANPLVAEVRRLRAENVALKAKDLFLTEYKSQIAESDATIAALRAENEELHAQGVFGCESPPPGCGCAGCWHSRKYEGGPKAYLSDDGTEAT